MTATVLLLVPPADAGTAVPACSASSPTTSTPLSALGEIGNIVGTSYVNALGRR